MSTPIPIPQVPLSVHIALTKAFIYANPVSITLVPRVETPDGAGGKKRTAGTPRAAQTFTLIEPGNSGHQQPVVTDAGEQYTVDFMLLGMPTAQIARNDVFTHGGREYKVLEIMPSNGYETRAVVIRHGW